MMINSLKTFMYFGIRGYRNKQQGKSYQNNVNLFKNMIQKNLYSKNTNGDSNNIDDDIDDYDYDYDYDYDDDKDKDDADFTDIHKTHKQLERQSKYELEKLKMKIVKKKYFDIKEPSFLTWSEKEEIRNLYEQDKVEWSPDRLAECFPALPQTITKILKTKWKPNNINTIYKYDKNVIDNWEKFKKGQLSLDPILAQHLNKFKDRNIDIESLKYLAHKFIKDKPIFPEPKNKLFISIIQHDDDNNNNNQNNQNNELLLKISDGNIEKKSIQQQQQQQQQNNLITINNNKKIKNDKQYTTFDEFLEKTIDKLSNNINNNTNDNELSVENKLLIEEYKNNNNNKVSNDFVDNSLTTTTMSMNNNVDNNYDNDDDDISTSIVTSNLHIDENSPTTGIIERKIMKSSLSSENDYPRYIKIPQARAKEGVTFRVQDKYYDWDGEFLYRVPGLKS